MRLYSLILPIIIVAALLLGIGGYYYINGLDTYTNVKSSPIAKLEKVIEENEVEVSTEMSDLESNDIINILLLGIDRRSRAESSYRTDIMILLSIDKAKNRVLLTSVPRDLWYGGGRINAYYISSGWGGMQKAFEEITGLRPDSYILTDFKDFSWIVDAFGGVPVTVETSFTDHLFPNDVTNEYMTVAFTAGPQVMTGENALIYSRSRKGDNDNGDWGRMKRQHILLKGILDAAVQPESFVCDLTENPFKNSSNSCAEYVNRNTLEKVLDTVTDNKMETNLKLIDLVYLWDFYKDKDKYIVESLFMDHEFVHTPPASEYGGAWVLAPTGNSYTNFQTVVKNKLTGIEPLPSENSADPTPTPPF